MAPDGQSVQINVLPSNVARNVAIVHEHFSCCEDVLCPSFPPLKIQRSKRQTITDRDIALSGSFLYVPGDFLFILILLFYSHNIPTQHATEESLVRLGYMP